MDTGSDNETDDATEKLLQELREVVEDGEELLRAGSHELSSTGAAARERLSAALDAARETGRQLQERTIAGAKTADRAIRGNPYQSIGVAFGLGVLMGVLLRRR